MIEYIRTKYFIIILFLTYKSMKQTYRRPIKYTALSILAVVLLLSVSSYKMIPFGNIDGLDFNNVYQFITCSEIIKKDFAGNIYIASPAVCGDVNERPFVYPPLLYHSLSWVKLFPTFESALIGWRIFTILSMLLCLYFWVNNFRHYLYSLPFTIILLMQFPSMFALERGGSDILIIIFWTISYSLFKRKYFYISGIFASAAALAKIYPIFSLAIITCSLLTKSFLDDPKKIISREKISTKFIIGVISAMILNTFLFRDQWFGFFKLISNFASWETPLTYLSHSLQSILAPKIFSKLIFLFMISIWTIKAIFDKKNDPKISFAGTLAISTYYSNVTYDYNLITTYPFLVIIFSELIINWKWSRYFVLLALTIAITGHRGLYLWNKFPHAGEHFKLFFQLATLAGIPLLEIPYWKIKNGYTYLATQVKISQKKLVMLRK